MLSSFISPRFQNTNGKKWCYIPCAILGIFFILFFLVFIIQIAYYTFTSPDWGFLNKLVSQDDIKIIKSKHSVYPSYSAEFSIEVLKNEEKFISNIRNLEKDGIVNIGKNKDKKPFTIFFWKTHALLLLMKATDIIILNMR